MTVTLPLILQLVGTVIMVVGVVFGLQNIRQYQAARKRESAILIWQKIRTLSHRVPRADSARHSPGVVSVAGGERILEREMATHPSRPMWRTGIGSSSTEARVFLLHRNL